MMYRNILFALILLSSCYQHQKDPCLSVVNLTDQNGMSETINSKERLKQFSEVDFLKNQPYQKVLRVYERDGKGNIAAVITSYHPNGLPKHYLEILNNRAFGTFREWHPNGKIKIESQVVGGPADITIGAQKNWLFDGLGNVWNEDGFLEAEINYSNGELEGRSTYFHPNGTIWKQEYYHHNKLHGPSESFLASGAPFQICHYNEGKKEGISERFWEDGSLASHELYYQGSLVQGAYFNLKGVKISEIKEGSGWRAIFGKRQLTELQEYREGKQEGLVKVYDIKGTLVRTYHIQNDLKEGEEIEYYPPAPLGNQLSKLSVSWKENKIHGPVKSWFENGKLESVRAMSENKKNGVLTAWYRDGNTMLIEEYDHDKLVKGEYFRKGDHIPISNVTEGNGIAYLFDPEGNPTKKISYREGKPIE